MKRLKDVLIQSHVPFKDGQIVIPDWVRHIKFDVGLSYNAPITQQWVTTEENLLVFGFEPDPTSLQSLLDPQNTKRLPGHGTLLEYKYLNNRVFVIPVALGSIVSEVDFYVTEGGGCSSVYKPKENFRSVHQKVKVPIYKLSDFFELMPWSDLKSRGIEYVEYIKIDAQGHDLEIVKGLGDYISKVVYITLEAESSTYHQAEGNNFNAIGAYLNSKHFAMVKHPGTTDPTFINIAYAHLADKIYIYQNG